MYLILIAWIYVTLMMAVAEAAAPGGTLAGGAITLVFYGLLPAALIGYILGTPARKRARRARDEAASREDALTAGSANEPDAGGHAAAGAETRGIAPVGEEAGRIGDRAPPL
ncbi:hypothetical protein [Comamonas sp. SCN 65-56]|uniref:hypothetical protein n=1 Tax=Comamonas sp. SCN 65-56 TaxID=1660095 RepID=UPI0025C3217B|nr:hypothetical protein [Comamonas sp. SCN 65-56]